MDISESENINKFDLTNDWGWFYFFTKPLFFIMNYLFETDKKLWDSNPFSNCSCKIIFLSFG